MPHIKSLFRSANPLSTPTINYYDWVMGHAQLTSRPDFTLHIDAVTGEQRQARDVLERFEHAAAALAASPRDGGLGLVTGPGKQVVGILSQNCLEYPVLVFALLKMAVPIAFFPSQSALQETVELLKLSCVTCLFASEQLYPHAVAAAKIVGFSEKNIFILQGEVPGKTSLPRLIEDVKARGLPKIATREVQDDTLAYLMFSSGTTGLPKAVMISHRNLIFSASDWVSVNEETARVYPSTAVNIPVHLAVLPWYHAMGGHVFLFRLFITPYTLVVLPRWNVDLVTKAFSRYPITHFIMVPSMMHQILHHPELSKLDLSSLKSAATGASQLPPEVLGAFKRRARNLPFFVEGYGLSECTFAAMLLPLPGMHGGRVDPVRGMTGILCPSIEARVLREDGSEADYDEIGELILRGPTLALGYWNNEKATREMFKDGWLYTGDRFYVDKQERFFYVDRAKDTFKVSGKQVSPSEIENTLREHPSQLIIDVVVAGVKGERMSSEVVPRAWVVLSNIGKEQGVEATLATLDEWARLRLSKHKWLRGGLQAVDELPKLPTGKILRRKLQDEYAREYGRTGSQTKLLAKL